MKNIPCYTSFVIIWSKKMKTTRFVLELFDFEVKNNRYPF